MGRKPREGEKELSDLEVAVMDVVWELGDCTSAEVIERFTARRPLAVTTIRTVLASVEKKGFLERLPTSERGLSDTRGIRYRPLVSREAVAGRTLRKLVASLFGGSPRHAVAYLLREGDLADADLDEIGRLLTEHRQKERP